MMCERPMGMMATANRYFAKRIAVSPVKKENRETLLKFASFANSTQPPHIRTINSPKPSQTASIVGAAKIAGTFNNVQMMRYGNNILIDHAAEASNISPIPQESMIAPDR